MVLGTFIGNQTEKKKPEDFLAVSFPVYTNCI